MRTLHFKILEDGKLPIGIRETLVNFLPQFAGKEMILSIAEKKDTVSDKQLRYYFGVIVSRFQKHFAAQGQGCNKENLHDAMMRNIGGFNNPFVNPFTGEPDEGRKSYKALTKAQAEGYHTLCRKWAATKGFDIPEPHEISEDQYEY